MLLHFVSGVAVIIGSACGKREYKMRRSLLVTFWAKEEGAAAAMQRLQTQ